MRITARPAAVLFVAALLATGLAVPASAVTPSVSMYCESGQWHWTCDITSVTGIAPPYTVTWQVVNGSITYSDSTTAYGSCNTGFKVTVTVRNSAGTTAQRSYSTCSGGMWP